MKLKITYQPEEQEEADGVLAVIRRLLPGVRLHKTTAKAPYIHVYLTTKKPGNRCNSKEKP